VAAVRPSHVTATCHTAAACPKTLIEDVSEDSPGLYQQAIAHFAHEAKGTAAYKAVGKQAPYIEVLGLIYNHFRNVVRGERQWGKGDEQRKAFKARMLDVIQSRGVPRELVMAAVKEARKGAREPAPARQGPPPGPPGPRVPGRSPQARGSDSEEVAQEGEGEADGM
jgi:hypothetical protein